MDGVSALIFKVGRRLAAACANADIFHRKICIFGSTGMADFDFPLGLRPRTRWGSLQVSLEGLEP